MTQTKWSTQIVCVGDFLPLGQFRPILSSLCAVNLINSSNQLLSLVSETVGGGPINIVTGSMPIPIPVNIEITEWHIRMEDRIWNRSSLHQYHSTLTSQWISPPRMLRRLNLLRKTLQTQITPEGAGFLIDPDSSRISNACWGDGFRQRFTEGVKELQDALVRNRDPKPAVAQLKGLGPGLTPSGDDFLGGVLAALYLIEKSCHLQLELTRKQILMEALGENPFSNALLECCAQGRFFQGFKKLMETLLRGDEQQVPAIATQAFAFGATSGIDLCMGFLLTMEWKSSPRSAGWVQNERDIRNEVGPIDWVCLKQ